MHDLHITLTEFRNETRVLKETRSIISHKIADRVFIAALHAPDLEFMENISDFICLKRFKLFTRLLPKNIIFQLLKYLEFLLSILFFFNKKEIGMVNIHSIGLLPIGVVLKYYYSSLLIYDTHELETETNGLKGIRKKAACILERIIIRHVDQIFVVSEAIADHYQSNYKIMRPVVVMNSPQTISVESSDYFRKNFSISARKRIFIYQGGLAPGRGVEAILDTFKSGLRDDVVVVFMGYGMLEPMIKSAAEEFDNIFFHPAVPPDNLLEFTASADAGISLIENTCLSYLLCMPNKLFEYLMAGLPVVVSNMQEMARFVLKNNVGVVSESLDPEGLANAIDRLMAMDLQQLSKNAREVSRRNSWDIQEEKMIAAYGRLLKDGEI